MAQAKEQEIANLAADMSHALALLRASRELYNGMLSAVRDHVTAEGDADVEKLLARFNAALTEFAPRDFEIRRLQARYRPGSESS